MTSHRRPGLLERLGLRPRRTLIPEPQRPPGVELVDARDGMRHRVSFDALLTARLTGVCQALCGAPVRMSSLTDPGRGWCRWCRS